MLFQLPGFSFPVNSGGLGGWAILLGLVLWAGPVQGQDRAAPAQFVRTQWTAVEEGVPSNGVRDIVQTDGGYLWLGTEGGLARFDGVAFEETRVTRLEAETRTGDRILDISAYGEGLLVLYRSRDLLHYQKNGVTPVADSVWAFQAGGDGRVGALHG